MPERQEIAMLRPLIIGRLVISLLAAGSAAGWGAQAEPRMIYTRHTLKVDLHGLDLGSDAGRRAFQARIADAADEVCGGRPDRGNRYTAEELNRMLPAYDQCRADALQRAAASLNLPDMARLAQTVLNQTAGK
jgi:UrcA family protein